MTTGGEVGNEAPLTHPFVSFGVGISTPEVSPAQVGGKAAGLIAMAATGLPVPTGVVLPTAAYRTFAQQGWTATLERAVRSGVSYLERLTGSKLGDPERPLLVSVRSGAPISMPGMMDTVLNVGTTPEVVTGLAWASRDDAFGLDTYRRFLRGYATTVAGLEKELADELVARAASPAELLQQMVRHGCEFPSDPVDQVIEATKAVFRSWDSDRARTFRLREGISDDLGTAVIIQQMVFGNLGLDSGTGVAFSRDPSTGTPGMMGDFLAGAQGEDVVSGDRNTLPLGEMALRWPVVHEQLSGAVEDLERQLLDMVDVEFTVERGRLYILQSRRGRRSMAAAMRVAVDLAEDPAFPIGRTEAVTRCRDLVGTRPASVNPLPSNVISDHLVARGLAASPGRGAGVLVVSVEDALRRDATGEDVVLVRSATSPSDVAAMSISKGIVTVSGGLVSHAAIVARSWGIPAVVSADELVIDEKGIRGRGGHVAVGEIVTVDGSAGLLLSGLHRGTSSEPPALTTLRRWAAEFDVGVAGDVDEFGALAEPGIETDGLDALRLVVLRHRTDLAGLASALAVDQATLSGIVERLQGEALLTRNGALLSPTMSGRALVAVEAGAVADAHGPDFEALLGRFHQPNLAFKEIVTAWQVRGGSSGTEPSHHADPVYDEMLLAQLRVRVHPSILGIIAEAAEMVARLARYGARLTAALTKLEGGDHRFIASPLVDSYHTVWFELHEELIVLAGTDRETEEAAGRA